MSLKVESKAEPNLAKFVLEFVYGDGSVQRYACDRYSIGAGGITLASKRGNNSPILRSDEEYKTTGFIPFSLVRGVAIEELE